MPMPAIQRGEASGFPVINRMAKQTSKVLVNGFSFR